MAVRAVKTGGMLEAMTPPAPPPCKLVRLSTVGILQYIAPTLIFLYAVLVFGEPFDQSRRIAFPLIWAALVLYSLGLWRQYGAARRKARVTGRMQ